MPTVIYVLEKFEKSRWARAPSKIPGVNNFLSFNSIILKLGTKKELVILWNPTLFVFEILEFWQENDVTNLGPNFGNAQPHSHGFSLWIWEGREKGLKTLYRTWGPF